MSKNVYRMLLQVYWVWFCLLARVVVVGLSAKYTFSYPWCASVLFHVCLPFVRVVDPRNIFQDGFAMLAMYSERLRCCVVMFCMDLHCSSSVWFPWQCKPETKGRKLESFVPLVVSKKRSLSFDDPNPSCDCVMELCDVLEFVIILCRGSV